MNALIPDLYGPGHRALRRAIAELLSSTVPTDPAEPSSWRRFEASWDVLAGRLDCLSAREEQHLHPLIRLAAPATAAMLDGQHRGLQRELRDIDERLMAMSAIDQPETRHRAGSLIFALLADLMAGCLEHLTVEESCAAPALIGHFAPPTLFAASRAMNVEPPTGTSLLDQLLANRRRIGGQPALIEGTDTPMTVFFAEAGHRFEIASRRQYEPPLVVTPITDDPAAMY